VIGMVIKEWKCMALIVLLLMLVPSYASGATIKAISAGSGSMVLMDDGTVYAWGNNASHATPEKVQGLTNITAISAYNCNYMALRDDGTVWAWVWQDNQDAPPRMVQVPISNITAISVPTMLRNDGTVWETVPPLKNPYYAVDIYNGSATVSVRQVSGLDNVEYIGRNAYIKQDVAMKNDGTVWMWGNDNNLIQVNISDVKEMVASDTTILALKNDGTVWAWGSNWHGLFGNGMTSFKIDEVTSRITDETTLIPVQVKGLSNVTSISIQNANAMALKEDGSVWVWGSDQFNALGIYAAANSYTPQKLISLNNVVAISMGYGHGMALKNDGTLWAWGANFEGQLGDGTVTPALEHGGGKENPVKVLTDTSGPYTFSATPVVSPSSGTSIGPATSGNASIVAPSAGNSAVPVSNGSQPGDSTGLIIMAIIALIVVSGFSLRLRKK
jgi:alpha-tubulin suppressor-like RCC1 family protein